LMVLGLKLRVLCLLGRCSTTWVPLLFVLVYFSGRVPKILPRPASDQAPPTYTSHVSEIAGMGHPYSI
jgi:hypothetical protein